ncbi:MAG: ABC transporter permease [Bacteroidetes bacterium]|nr:ABC transporter permease [Bacteroidota bacterium]
MTRLLTIAWRNVWRHPARSMVIIMSVALGLWAGMFVMSFYVGFGEERVASAIETEISHIQIHHPKFKDDEDVRFSIPNAARVTSVVRSLPQVAAISPRLIARGMIGSANGSTGVEVNGVDPQDEARVTKLPTKLIDGKYFPGQKHNELLVGQKLAQKLKARIGSKLVVTLLDTSGNIVAGAFRVAGIFRTKNEPYDERNVFALSSDLDGLFGVDSLCTEIAVLLHTSTQVDTVAPELAKKFPQLLVQDWRSISPELDLVVSSIDMTMYIFMGIVLLAMAFGIVNTMLMAVLERTREIGMLIALGMNRRRVFGMIVSETFFLVLVGCPVGMLMTFATVSYFGKYGIDISAFQQSLRAFGYEDVVYPKLGAEHYVLVLVLVAVTAFLSAMFPARKALKLQPAEAIRK